ncbi:MAG: hypothetical protein H6807_00665 [Planctomycetes bacterium]|nr:hypothetical protein [Planctomycetota bacterium]
MPELSILLLLDGAACAPEELGRLALRHRARRIILAPAAPRPMACSIPILEAPGPEVASMLDLVGPGPNLILAAGSRLDDLAAAARLRGLAWSRIEIR